MYAERKRDSFSRREKTSDAAADHPRSTSDVYGIFVENQKLHYQKRPDYVFYIYYTTMFMSAVSEEKRVAIELAVLKFEKAV